MYFYTFRGSTVVLHYMDPEAPDYRLSKDAGVGTFTFSGGRLRVHFDCAVPQDVTFILGEVPSDLQSGMPTLNYMPTIKGRFLLSSEPSTAIGIGPMQAEELKRFGLPGGADAIIDHARSASQTQTPR